MWKTRVSTYAAGAAACLAAAVGLAEAAPKGVGGGAAHPAFHAPVGGIHPCSTRAPRRMSRTTNSRRPK